MGESAGEPVILSLPCCFQQPDLFFEAVGSVPVCGLAHDLAFVCPKAGTQFLHSTVNCWRENFIGVVYSHDQVKEMPLRFRSFLSLSWQLCLFIVSLCTPMAHAQTT